MDQLTSKQQELLDLLGRLIDQGREGASVVFLNHRLRWGLERVEEIAKQLVESNLLQARITRGGTVYILPEKPVGAGKPKTLAEIFEARTRDEPQKISPQLLEKFTAAGIVLPDDWFGYLKNHESRLVLALQSLDLPVTIAADHHIEALDQEDLPDKLGVLIEALLYLSRKTRASDPVPPSSVLPNDGADEREFRGIRNRWEILRVLPAMREFIRYHDINSIAGLVNRLGRYGSVAESFMIAGGIEIAQPTAEEIRAILPGLSKFSDRLDFNPPEIAQPMAPTVSFRAPELKPIPLFPTPAAPPPVEEEQVMPVMTQVPDPKAIKDKKAGKAESDGYPTWERLQKSPGFGRLNYKNSDDFARDFLEAGRDPATLFRIKGKAGMGLAKTYELVRQYAIGAGLGTAEPATQKAPRKPLAQSASTQTAASAVFFRPEEEAKYGIPTEALLRCCNFLKSGAWRQLREAGMPSIVGLVAHIDKHGGNPAKMVADMGVAFHWNKVNPLEDLLPLFRQYGNELDKITTDEARKIADRLKWHKRRAEEESKKKRAIRQAAPKASLARKEPAQTALVPISQGIITGLEIIRLQGKLAERQGMLAEILMPIAIAINGINGDQGNSLETLVRAIENDLGLLGVRANTNAGLLEMARHVLALQKVDLSLSPAEPSKK